MDDTLMDQSNLSNLIRDAAAAINETPAEEWSEGLLFSRLELLDGYWNDFQANHALIVRSATPRDHPYFAERVYVTVRGRIYDVRASLHQMPVQNMEPQRGSSRLPQIAVPQFSGRRGEWEPFRDLFRSLIHSDPTLSNVDKMYYLKTYVQGEARSAIDDLQVTGANYATAWNNLEARYDHQRLLVQDHLKALKTIKPLKEESSYGLQHLLDQLKRHRSQLQSMGRPVDSWDDWIISFACDAMDSLTRRNWEEEIELLEAQAPVENRRNFHPTFAALQTFLQRRCRTLQAIETTRQQKWMPGTNRSSEQGSRGLRVCATAVDPPCPLCQDPHYLGHCARFREIAFRARKELVARQKLCFNCLRLGHEARTCPSQFSCRNCGEQHHTLLYSTADKRFADTIKSGIPSKRAKDDDADAVVLDAPSSQTS